MARNGKPDPHNRRARWNSACSRCGPWRSMLAKFKPSLPERPTVRGADDPPPEGAVDWVLSMEHKCGAAEPETILHCLRTGLTLNQAGAGRQL
jgi:hypothetical protein